MSFRAHKELSLAGYTPKDGITKDKDTLFAEALAEGMHGICFSLYEEGQKPGDVVTEAQIERRMAILEPYTKWIRSFSCTEGNEMVPVVARRHGMKNLVGAWLSDDLEQNEVEIAGLICMAKEGLVDVAAVGNEVLYREELTVDQLISYIERVKAAIPDIPVGYVDAYYEFRDHPEVSAACDVILANCYPFWESCPFEYSLLYMKEMYRQAAEAGKGKPVIITETGWPSQGEACKAAVPSQDAALEYFLGTQQWCKTEDIPVFYFSSFDEDWKVGAEGDVGAYWGLWDKHENLKYGQ